MSVNTTPIDNLYKKIPKDSKLFVYVTCVDNTVATL